MTVYYFGKPQHTKYETKEECVEHGGHCYESDNIILTSIPPQYPESCKHCPARRIGTPQPNMSYKDV